MKVIIIREILCSALLLGMAVGAEAQKKYFLKNRHLERVICVTANGHLSTVSMNNRLAEVQLPLSVSSDEFRLRISKGTDMEGTDRILTAKDFKVSEVSSYTNPMDRRSKGYCFELQNEDLAVEVVYELKPSDFYARKKLVIKPAHDLTLERVDVEAVGVEDAQQNYTIREIYAQGASHWKPGLGQPVYTSRSASFWGVEFPAATNAVEGRVIYCGYSPAVVLKAGDTYTTYSGVVGMADAPDFTDDAFYEYIDRIRIRPARLQIQYNSWFDFGQSVSSEKFVGSLQTVHEELVEKRGCPALNAYVIDDGWQDAGKTADWRNGVWTVNPKFQSDFKDCFLAVDGANSQLGLWLSPASILGARPMVPRMGEYGWESLGMGMSMTGPVYMQKLEERILELARMGVSYFKFDGLFGHLNTRDFEVKGRGTAYMPQLGVSDFKGNEKELNDARYNELKEYYLCNGTERLMKIFKKLHGINPDIFLAITNGAYLSPWWMQYVDVVWLINAGDAASGNSRTQELVYRDGIYYQIWEQENTKFPMNSIFNHEPKKTSTGEPEQTFRDYLFMNLSRGTGFIELYIKTQKLSASDWDVMAEGVKWAYRMFPAFRHVRMHGGDPRKGDVYGYTAWDKKRGYISFHNPSDVPQEYVFVLDRKHGVPEDLKRGLRCSSPLSSDVSRFPAQVRYGDEIRLTLQPQEIVLLDFDN